MATTTNFGWTTPNDTDLVKDGASAIRTLGSSIDTSMMDLKGGTTGQVLAKASNADMDFVWSADAAGMTNPMTTTGDMIYSSSGSTPARRAIGTTGQVLTVSGGLPTWATPSGGTDTWSLISTVTTTGVSTISVTGLSGYKRIFAIGKLYPDTSGTVTVRGNGSSASNYRVVRAAAFRSSTSTFLDTFPDQLTASEFYTTPAVSTSSSNNNIFSIHINNT